MTVIHMEGKILKASMLAIALALFCSAAAAADESRLRLATTTSLQDTGLLDVLVPLFEKKTGHGVKTIAVGSGQAMAMGRRGEADVLLVHSPKDEEAFMEEGFGVNRRIVMHNDFVLAGPPGDKAKVKGGTSIAGAFGKIASSGALFVS